MLLNAHVRYRGRMSLTACCGPYSWPRVGSRTQLVQTTVLPHVTISTYRITVFCIQHTALRSQSSGLAGPLLVVAVNSEKHAAAGATNPEGIQEDLNQSATCCATLALTGTSCDTDIALHQLWIVFYTLYWHWLRDATPAMHLLRLPGL